MTQKIKKRSVELAEATNRSKSHLSGQAINDYLNIYEWQRQETQKAVMLADSPHAEWLDHQSLKSLWSVKLES